MKFKSRFFQSIQFAFALSIGALMSGVAATASPFTIAVDNSILTHNGATVFSQDFDADTTGWSDFGGTISQVASGGGVLGATSAGGSLGHAEITFGLMIGNGAFTGWNDINNAAWPGTSITQSLDVYIDPSEGDNGFGWFLDNAINGTNGSWLEAGGVGALKVGSSWWLSADADGAAYQGPSTGGVGLEITAAGWYTIISEWVVNEDDSDKIDRNTIIQNSAGTPLYSVADLEQVGLSSGPNGPAGGDRYGWLGPSQVTLPSPIPGPASGLLWLAGMAGVWAFRRRA